MSSSASVRVERRPSVMLLVSTLGVGGAERHTITLANLLSAQYDVVLVSLKRSDGADAAMAGHVERGGLRALECLDVAGRFDPAAIARLAALQRQHDIDVVLCANTYPLLHAQWTRWQHRTRAKVVEIYHTTIVSGLGARAQLLFYRPFFWLVSRLVFVCETQRHYCVRRGILAGRMEVIHNGVDLRRFSGEGLRPPQDTRAQYGFGATDRVIGICAVFRPEKAHGHLLEAVASLKARGLPWKVLLIGDGPERARIEATIHRLGLRDDVRITGFLSDVRHEVVACDAIALVSTSIETFSIAALEAMALGRPMVMSRVGGAEEQVTDGVNGLLFPAGDVAALSGALERLCDDLLRARMGRAARARVVDQFSQETMLARYVRLIESTRERSAGTSPAGHRAS